MFRYTAPKPMSVLALHNNSCHAVKEFNVVVSTEDSSERIHFNNLVCCIIFRSTKLQHIPGDFRSTKAEISRAFFPAPMCVYFRCISHFWVGKVMNDFTPSESSDFNLPLAERSFWTVS